MKIILSILFVLIFSINSNAQADSLFLLKSTFIHFDIGQYDFTATADSILMEIQKEYVNKKNIHIKVTAHTDATGSLKANEKLSQKRANTITNFFINNNLDASLISAEFYGENQAVANNQTEEGRQQNRRARIEVFEKTKTVLLKGQITDEQNKGILAEVFIRSKSFKDSLQTDTAGYFQKKLPDHTVIGIDVFAKGHFMHSQMIKVTSEKTTSLNIPLPKVTNGKKIDIKNLYFVGSQAILLKKSKPILPKLLYFMQINDSLNIEIAGHVNVPLSRPVSKYSWEFNLSIDRAKLVYNYLIENGIAPHRLSFEGYGNWEMRYPNAKTAEHQEANRRVEIRIKTLMNDI